MLPRDANGSGVLEMASRRILGAKAQGKRAEAKMSADLIPGTEKPLLYLSEAVKSQNKKRNQPQRGMCEWVQRTME